MSVTIDPLRFGAPARLAERRPVGRRARRIGLTIFFVSVAVNAALGIYAVLAPGFGDTQGKILATSLCVTGAVLVALACEPAWERRLFGPVPLLAAGLGALGFALTIGGIWAEPESDAWGNVTVTTFALSSGGIAASLLVLARLAPRHEWLLKVTFALLALGTALYAVLPWLGEPPSGFMRALGVVMIALAAFAVTVPVVHWLDRGALAAVEATTGGVRFCPYCGRELAGEIGMELSCSRCGREFTVSPTEAMASRVST
jgi:hypothetical protein